jgi:hypothetical protein
MQGYDVVLQVQAQCDTTLLAHGSDAQWHFDDDSAGSLQPRLTVPSAALNGRLDLWVGHVWRRQLSRDAVPAGGSRRGGAPALAATRARSPCRSRCRNPRRSAAARTRNCRAW